MSLVAPGRGAWGLRLLVAGACFVSACDESEAGSDAADAGPSVDAAAAPDAADEAPPACRALDACGAAAPAPSLTAPLVVAPSVDLPPEVVSQNAHNNLDVVWHDGRLFFAFRTAPNHWASADTVLYVVSTADHAQWRFEGRFAIGTDLREPRFVRHAGRLWLYYAVLGTDPLDFEPQGTLVAEWLGPGRFSEPRAAFDFAEDFIPWRVATRGEDVWLVGYAGGAGVYDPGGNPIRVYLLRSRDGETWTDGVPGKPVVHTGGVSETAFAFLPDGGLAAVGRNEAGDERGFGSRICRASAEALADWTCAEDERRYDSPLLIAEGGSVWLVARRNLNEDGHYDLDLDDLPREQRQVRYQADYWRHPKRCSLWRVDVADLKAEFVLDLPSAGDTCFPSAVPLGDRQHLIYNYSSPFERADASWIQGQNGPTFIYRTTLTLP